MTHDPTFNVYAPTQRHTTNSRPGSTIRQQCRRADVRQLHADAFINSGPYGTTVYISKPGDVALAPLVERRAGLGRNQGRRDRQKSSQRNAARVVPAVLVETETFISNRSDYALLTSPAWRQKVRAA